MRLHSKVEYALLAAVDLAAHHPASAPVKTREIASRTGAPAKYLGQLLLLLKARMLVRSTRGPTGGYRLMRPPELISAAEVMDAVASNNRGHRSRRPAHSPYSSALNWLSEGLAEARRDFLSSVTLADLAARSRPQQT